MKYLLNLSIVLLLGVCFTSCSDDSEMMEPEISGEEQLEGKWILTEANLDATQTEPTSALTYDMIGKNSNSTLEMDILSGGEAELSGLLSMELSFYLEGLDILSFEVDEEYNESRVWKINEEGKFEFTNVVDDFSIATISADTLIFIVNVADAAFCDDEEIDEIESLDDMELELIFVKS